MLQSDAPDRPPEADDRGPVGSGRRHPDPQRRRRFVPRRLVPVHRDQRRRRRDPLPARAARHAAARPRSRLPAALGPALEGARRKMRGSGRHRRDHLASQGRAGCDEAAECPARSCVARLCDRRDPRARRSEQLDAPGLDRRRRPRLHALRAAAAAERQRHADRQRVLRPGRQLFRANLAPPQPLGAQRVPQSDGAQRLSACVRTIRVRCRHRQQRHLRLGEPNPATPASTSPTSTTTAS